MGGRSVGRRNEQPCHVYPQTTSGSSLRPGCTSVNASPRRLSDDTHHSRPRRLARSYLVRLFHSLPLSGFRQHPLAPLPSRARNRRSALVRVLIAAAPPVTPGGGGDGVSVPRDLPPRKPRKHRQYAAWPASPTPTGPEDGRRVAGGRGLLSGQRNQPPWPWCFPLPRMPRRRPSTLKEVAKPNSRFVNDQTRATLLCRNKA